MKYLKILFASLILLPTIVSAQTFSQSSITRTLQKGMRDNDVKQLQQMLATDASVYPEGLITGYFGPLTQKAIKLFQQKNGLATTGKINIKTLDKINAVIKNANVNISANKFTPSLIAPTVSSITNVSKVAIKENNLIQPQISIPAPDTKVNSVSTTTEHYIIRYKQNPNKNDEDYLKNNHKAKLRHTFKIIPAISADMDKTEVEKLSSDQNILSIEIDKKIQIQDLEFDNTWGVTRVGATTTQSNGINGTGIKVAVLDTGIDYNHPELVGEYSGGYNFVDGNTNPMDDNGHGTHVAGTIAAAHNSFGVVGVSPNVKIYALKVLDGTGVGYASSIISALDWAIANGIQITNNSYGSASDLGTTVNDAFQKAEQAGILSIAAAGNSGTCVGDTDTVEYPAEYSSVVAVAASNSNDNRPCFSSTGSKVELTAPGINITSAKLGGGYIIFNGTSMAAPHVTGVAALVAQAQIEMKQIPTSASIRQILDNTATDLGQNGRDTFYGYGLVNASNAVALVMPTSIVVPIISEPIATTTQPVATTTPIIPTTQPIATTTSPITPIIPPTATTSSPIIPTSPTIPNIPITPITPSYPVLPTLPITPGMPTLPITPVAPRIPTIPNIPANPVVNLPKEDDKSQPSFINNPRRDEVATEKANDKSNKEKHQNNGKAVEQRKR